MFAQTWRNHWGLTEDPFAHEDADKDPVLARVDEQAVHSCFDRVYGQPDTPGPAVIFGEKGSGKSGLRLSIQRRIATYNDEHPAARVLEVEYSEFDGFLESFRQATGLAADTRRSAPELVSRFGLADHLDGMLSVAVTTLVDRMLARGKRPKKLTRKRKLDLLLLTATYYNSKHGSTREALNGMRSLLRYRSSRTSLRGLVTLALALAGAAVALVPVWNGLEIGPTFEHGTSSYWFAGGAVLLAGTGFRALLERSRLHRMAQRATRSVRVLQKDPTALIQVLETLSAPAREEVVLPIQANEATRYDLLQHFVSALEGLGYTGLYVLVDRVDESAILGGKEDLTRAFVETLLDHKLLQHPGLALKLFLPVELSKMYMGASPEELKRMRLDKSNTVQELRWTGQELYEIANQRLRAAGASTPDLETYLGDGMTGEGLRDALHELGTPRHAFGFLSTLFSEFARNLPEDLGPEAPEWRIPRAHFDLVFAAWGDRARVLRRALN
ncbi:MAG: hypothetical protein ACI8QZ_002108 [Chlamydiales bacterium]|jgi:hypothetical protein